MSWTSLAAGADPEHFMIYAENYGAWGIVLSVIMLIWAIVFGVAAAAVRPWAWYVVIAAPLVAVVSSAIFAVHIASTPFDAWLGGGLVVTSSLISFVYFY